MAENTNDVGNLDSLFVATPCYGDVDHQYHLSTINLAGECFRRGVANHNYLVASSIVSQGRNICVSEFLNNRRFDNMLFVDADIYFDPETAFKLLNSPYDIALVPYPVKQHFWEKSRKALKNHPAGNGKILGNKYSLRKAPSTKIIDDAWMELEHGPAGFMLIRRKVFEAIIEQKPKLKINKEVFTQGGMRKYMNLYNFFDFKFNPKSGQYTGEDFNFCKLARNCGFKIHAYLNDCIAHCGRHEYTGRYRDELLYDFSE